MTFDFGEDFSLFCWGDELESRLSLGEDFPLCLLGDPWLSLLLEGDLTFFISGEEALLSSRDDSELLLDPELFLADDDLDSLLFDGCLSLASETGRLYVGDPELPLLLSTNFLRVGWLQPGQSSQLHPSSPSGPSSSKHSQLRLVHVLHSPVPGS